MAHIFSTILGFPLITMSLMFYGLGLETKCFYSTIMKDIPVDFCSSDSHTDSCI